MEAGSTPGNGFRWRLEQLELWRRDREQARLQERIVERVAVIENELDTQDERIKELLEAIKANSKEVGELRKTLIVASLGITGMLAATCFTIWGFFG